MRFTLHGHRPGRSNVSGTTHPAARPAGQAQSTAEAPQAGAQAETVKCVHLGFVKLKIHRQSAQQSALLAQVGSPPAAIPARSTEGTATGTSTVQHVAASAALNTANAPTPATPDPDGLAELDAQLPLPPTGRPQGPSHRDASSPPAEALHPNPHDHSPLQPLSLEDRLQALTRQPTGDAVETPEEDDGGDNIVWNPASVNETLSAQLPLAPTGRPQRPSHRGASSQPAELNAHPADPNALRGLSLEERLQALKRQPRGDAVAAPEEVGRSAVEPAPRLDTPDDGGDEIVWNPARVNAQQPTARQHGEQLPWPASMRSRTAMPHRLERQAAPPADAGVRPAPGAVRASELPSRQANPDPLDRFVHAQADIYHGAINELQRGAKAGHWMWFVFPQLRALGQSSTAKRYGLENLQEARAYWEHPLLGARLRESIRTLLQTRGVSAESILGPGDAMKFRSCLTLFAEVDPSNRDIQLALARFYKNQPDELTQALIRS